MFETVGNQPIQDVRLWVQSDSGREALATSLKKAEAAQQSFTRDTRVQAEMMREPVTIR